MTAKTKARVPLSRERILRAALELADANGIESLSMRKVGQKLGFEAVSLYTHVANKDGVLDGILDLVLAEPAPPSSSEDWDTAIRESAVSLHDAPPRHSRACPRLMQTGRI